MNSKSSVRSMEMEQMYSGNSVCCDGLLNTLSTNNNTWLVAHDVDGDGMVNFYSLDEQASNYRCRIPELGGMNFRGFCHGWMILSNRPTGVMWSLWNPATSKLIRLPPFEGLDKIKIGHCCLSAPPGDPTSILLLTRSEKPNFVFCRLDRSSSSSKRKRSRWTEMSYAKQMERLMDDEEDDNGILDGLTCCNGKVYALSHDTLSVVLIEIKVVKDKQVVISILPFQKYPNPYFHSLPEFYVLKGSGTELFLITGRLDVPAGVYLFKLDLTTTTTPTAHDDDTTWEEIHDLKDAVFFVVLGLCQPVSYIPAVASGLGGYVHVRDECRIIIKSFHVKDKILLISPMPYLVKVTQVSMWEYRGLEADNGREVTCTDDHKQQQQQQQDKENDDEIVALTRSSNTEEESRLLRDVPFHVLETIMERCVGVEYMNFRATCKRCHLAAPRIHWRSKASLRKLEKYSLVSPWLMVVQAHEGVMNFTDPISGDKYLMKLRLPEELSLSYDELNSMSCSKYGWWLFYARSSSLGYHQLVFLNPFTNDVRKLPPTPPHYLESLCFSAPPTSTSCVVVGFSTKGHAAYILRYVEGDDEEQLLWRRFDISVDCISGAFRFPTFHGRDLYALCNEDQLVVFKDLMSEGSFSQPEVVAADPPLMQWPCLYPSQCFLMKRGQYLLLVVWGKFGADPKLLQFDDSTQQWTQIESLGRDVVFIGDATCICIQEAKTTPKMQNKIYFPRLKDEKLIFYSLETSEYHTFDGKLASREQVFEYSYLRHTLHLTLNAWIQPSWY